MSPLRAALALAFAASAVLAGCADDAERPVEHADVPAVDSGAITLDERARAFAGLQFAEARAVEVERTVATTGVLAWDPARVTAVAAPVRGRVLELTGTVGDRVATGAVVAVIENPDNLSGRFDVRAARGGVITERAASVGEVLDAGAPLLRVVDDRRLWLVVDLPPGSGPRPRVGSPVRADIPAAGVELRGTIDAILPEADGASHVARGRVVVDNPRRGLAAGMSALVSAGVADPARAVAVPRDAVVFHHGRSVVFSPAGASFRAVPVETGPPVGREEVAILAGLRAGDRVVTVGAQQLANARFDFRGLGDDEEEEEDEAGS